MVCQIPHRYGAIWVHSIKCHTLIVARNFQKKSYKIGLQEQFTVEWISYTCLQNSTIKSGPISSNYWSCNIHSSQISDNKRNIISFTVYKEEELQNKKELEDKKKADSAKKNASAATKSKQEKIMPMWILRKPVRILQTQQKWKGNKPSWKMDPLQKPQGIMLKKQLLR